MEIVGYEVCEAGSPLALDNGESTGIKTLAKKDKEKADRVADEIIKNTYRTLMTRGMKGCYVYCTDVLLAQYFKKLLKQN